jgi:predicted MFS family arabinose efflux permease
MLKNYLNNYKGFSKEIWILALMTFINRAGTMVIPFLSRYLKDNLHFDYNQIGWIMVFFGVGSLLGTWLSGKLSDMIGFYKVMVFSLFASGIVFFSLQYITTFTGLCMAILVLTTIADMFRPAMLVSLNSYTNKENRTRALSLVRAALSLGFLFGPALGGLIIMSVGYKYLFCVDSFTCILAIIVFVVFVKDKKLAFLRKKHTVSVEKYPMLKDKPFLMHLAITMITGVLFFQIFTILPIYHKEQFNLPEFYSGLLLSLNGLLILLFELPIVNYVKRHNINKLKVISLGIVSMVISFLLMLVNWEGVLVLMMLFMSCGVMLTFPFANEFAMSRSHTNKEGKYMAIFTMSYSIAHILSAKTGLGIIQNFGYSANWIFMSVLGFAGALLAYHLYFMVKKETDVVVAEDNIVNSIFSSNEEASLVKIQ